MPNIKKIDFTIVERKLVEYAWAEYMRAVQLVAEAHPELPKNVQINVDENRTGFLVPMPDEPQAITPDTVLPPTPPTRHVRPNGIVDVTPQV